MVPLIILAHVHLYMCIHVHIVVRHAQCREPALCRGGEGGPREGGPRGGGGGGGGAGSRQDL